MAATRKFAFDVSFDGVVQNDAPPAQAPAEPHYSAADLAAARERAFAEGHAAGEAAAKSAAAQLLADTLGRLAQHVGLLLAGQEESGRRNARAAIEVATAIVRKLNPELARRNGLVEVEGALAHCLESLRGEPRIVIRVHDSLLDPLRERLDQLAAQVGYEGRIVIIADGAIAAGDCRVEWADGGVERDTARLWREIEAALNRAAAADTAAQA